jgi:membrane associated rhomboid family serine protease
MRPASVGFQCPSCVHEGSKQTRSGRTAYGGERSGNPALTSQVLIGINLAVWLLILATGWRTSRVVDYLALTPYQTAHLSNGVPVLVHGVADGAPWQLVTSMFTQVEIWHIAFNMLALWVLGPQLELAVGRARFLAVYLLSGLAGSATVLWFSASYTQTLGASGAIFGLMGALLVVAIKVHGDVRGMLTWIGVNFFVTFVFVNNISWQGHVGGFAGGLLVGAAVVYAPPPRRNAWQLGAIALIAVVVLVATATRVTLLA